MAITRTFLGWSEPILSAAIKYLVAQHRGGHTLNFKDISCALPGRRAGRKLLELLALEGEKLGLPVIPPRIVTTGSLPELLLGIKKGEDSDLLRQSVWYAVLGQASSEELAGLFPKVTGGDSSFEMTRWEIAEYLDSLRREVGGAAKTFGDIPPLVEVGGSEERWQKLAVLENRYLSLLKSLGLQEGLAARAKSLQESPPYAGKVYLIGLSELNQITKDCLKRSLNVHSLIGAPESEADLFDEFGCVHLHKWSNRHVPLALDALNRADRMEDEAGLLLKELGALSRGNASSDCTIGLLDTAILPVLSEELGRAGINIRPPEGDKYKDSLPCTFLGSFVRFVEEPTVLNLGGLLRHPLSASLSKELSIDELLKKLDSYQERHFQNRIAGEIFGDSARDLQKALQDILALVFSVPKHISPLTAWRDEISRILGQVLGDRLQKESIEAEALERLAEFFNRADELPDSLVPKVRCTTAIRLALSSLANHGAPPKEHGTPMEAIGWLELFHDDAPNIFVTGFHEYALPEAINEDPVLPDGLRQRAGIQCNNSRYARDAFLVTALIKSRKTVKFSYSVLDNDGVERGASRLLYASPDSEIPARVAEVLKPGKVAIGSGDTKFELGWLNNLIPTETPKVDNLSVTDFAVYQDCPYNFYLTRLLRLRAVSDQNQELDALNFGTALHDILQRFAIHSEGKGSMTQEQIYEELLRITDEVWLKRFGSQALPAVYVQKEVIKERLWVWAAKQSELFSQGWQIHRTELQVGAGTLELAIADNKKISVIGRIDRIDYNERLNSYRIIDYKTGQKAVDANFALDRNGQWKDLQLPLYYFMLRNLKFEGEISFGYFNLSGEHASSGLEIIKADMTALDQALVKATDIAKQITSGAFWPPSSQRESFDTSLKLILNQISIIPQGGVI
jgi:RecB family exonuclease